MNTHRGHLFHSGDLRAQLEAQRKELTTAIHRLSPNQLTAENQLQVEAHFIEKNRITPLTLRPEDIVLEEPREIETRMQGHFESYIRKSLQFRFLIPFDGEAVLFDLQPSQFTMNPPAGAIEGRNVVFLQNRDDSDQAAIKQELKRFISSVDQYIGWQRPMIDEWNTNLPAVVKQQVLARRDKLIADRQLVDGLGFRIVRNGEAPRAAAVPIERRSVITLLPVARPGPVTPPDPVMDAKVYEDILETLENMSVVMERSPSSFTTIDEEALRTHFLVPLNANFRGMASGETFNAQGKTDILVKHQDRILFIAECKFWTGPKSLTDAISQLLSYTTWRETKAAILLFSRKKDFTAVLDQVPDIFAQYPQHVRREPYAKPTGFRFILRSPIDPQRHITVTLLAFNVPVET